MFVMAGQITALKVQARNRQRVNVYLDGRFAFGLAAIEAARLQVGQFLSDEEIARLQERDQVERAVNQALALLSYRPRSRREVHRRLAEKGYGGKAVEEALARLSRVGLLDDGAFARYWVENRFQFNPRGVTALRQELRQQGLDDACIEEALEGYDEEAAAVRAAAAALRRLRHLDQPTLIQRLVGYLIRRGFPYAIIQPLVQQVLAGRAPEDPLQEGET